MKTALRRLSLLLTVLLCCPSSYGQSQVFWLAITDSTAIDHIDTIGANYIPTFVDPMVNGTFGSGGGSISIEQAMPFADNLCLRWIWRVTGADSMFMNTLVTTYPTLFPAYEVMPHFDTLAHTPNDWNLLGLGGVDYLDFIGARNAWDASLGGTTGDSTVIIGIVDEYFDSTSVDIKSNSVAMRVGYQSGTHGTEVAGVAAGRTNNNYMLPSIGYKCKMNVSDYTDYLSELRRIVQDTTGGRVRVTNGSWGFDLPGALQIDPSEQVVCDEIYESGVTAVFGAGNGYKSGSGLSYTYYYPASLDHNISVTSVGHLNTSGSLHLRDIHESPAAGDSVHTHQHNDRVDICSPGWAFLLQSTGNSWQITSGTSYASPTVAGTTALMYSQQSCLTPYQVEYLLKKKSKDIYQQTWDGSHYYNAHYYNGVSRYNSRLGAGRLQADSAVLGAASTNFECNDSTTRTMYIDGVTLSHNCAPGTIVGLSNPQLKIGQIHNGKAPYTYLWTPIFGNTCIINDSSLASPQITNAGSGVLHQFYYRLAVYDASEIQKVATVMVKLYLRTDSVSDLSMRDSYYDMLDEPNSQFNVNHQHYDIWHSPDLWNRDTITIDSLIPEDPQYFSKGYPNYLFVRVKNVGCAANVQDANHLYTYWTYASTGEHWPNDWNGSNQVLDSNNSLTLPAGKKIDSTQVVPVLQPGQDTIIRIPWYPPMPEARSGKPQNVDVCLLARLLETSLPLNGLFYPDTFTRSATNINNNNNIVTLNVSLVNFGKACANCRIASNTGENTHRVYVASADSVDQVFDVQMLTQKDIQRHLSGDLSKYIYVTLALDSLYTRWQEAGGHGNYAAINAETKTVTYDPSSPLRLEGITLHPSEHFPIDVTFVQRNGVTVLNDIKDFNVYIQQIIHEGNKKHIYGAVVYSINIAKSDSTQQKNGAATNNSGTKPLPPSLYTVYPNPTSSVLNVRYVGSDNALVQISIMDISGKVVYKRSDVPMQSGVVYSIKMSSLSSGTYFIQLTNNSGQSYTQRFTKQ